ncbi:hypothetical protein GW869_01585 [bacterium]|uniref:Uncharacterized protein n=3 Tax=Candidatus Nealsoniibacteriota TaxID=1817911 RepID=A0A2M7EC50_9BACT|nr:hypothetical protein [bacterium]PIV65308.1 MAG: hypothetical protein COS09_00160 [Candidatus Nealsonbacteria bacterium CG01_land_8_20_14_3_00_12]PIW35178.1 MAG: hypothetical protein COW25_00780 [Candidatus Nealsonbacteria bacterium CG15_BIG_FIL_POST_REV_8_21_14_020_37_12]PJA83228.1 MAG: hypothetical protein CO146_01555 [Candidatus Nealsonbacteria bacterium CG_4_9_14_3_um_filter_37_29]
MHPKYQKALKLRFIGKSYGEIKCALGVPKSTLSSWFKNLQLPPSVQKILIEKGRATNKNLAEFNRRRTQAIKIENQQVRQAAAEEIKSLSKRELLLIGAALYWAEGYNKQDNVGSPNISFGNSDPKMVILFLRFLREVMRIPEEALRPIVQIHHNVEVKSAINFWSKISDIPQKFFHITHQISKASKGKRSTYSLPYGTFRLEVRGRQNFFRIKGWIDGLIRQI